MTPLPPRSSRLPQPATPGPEKAAPDPQLAAAALAAARRAGDPVLISGSLDAAAQAARAAGKYRQAHKLSVERSQLQGRLPRHEVRAGFEISDSRSITLAVAAGDLPGALSMADLAASNPLAGDQPMTLFRRVIALALQGDFDAAIADAAGMWQAWLRAGAPPAHWTAPAAHAAVLVCDLRGDSDGAREWRDRAAKLAAGQHQEEPAPLRGVYPLPCRTAPRPARPGRRRPRRARHRRTALV